jgi:hypothetical protein
MRRAVPLLLVLLVLLVAGCSGGERPTTDAAPSTSVAPEASLPRAVTAFVEDVAAPGSAPFRATYHVVRKLGGGETDVEVRAAPPSWMVTAGDIIVIDGKKRWTCVRSRATCTRGVRDQALAPTGVFSRFFASAPALALQTDARRSGAGTALTSTRTSAGVTMHCLSVPINGVTPSTYCLTDEGVFGFVDTPSVRYELTSYVPGPTDAVEVPF